jgi:hypothetical protein
MDRLRRAGASVKNLAHSAALAAWLLTVPPHRGIKQKRNPEETVRIGIERCGPLLDPRFEFDAAEP